MFWYIPSFHGDFRLESKDGASILTVEAATPLEREVLTEFLRRSKRKGWIPEKDEIDWTKKTEVKFSASIAKTAPMLVRITKPRDRTLTAVKFKDGKMEAVTSAWPDALEEVAEKAEKKGTTAVSLARPTPSCPQCVPGEIAPAGKVLREFLTPEQHEDWAQHRAFIIRGGTTNYRYIVAHRHSALAAKFGRMCYDLDNRVVVHFHDNSVPPEEEVLAAKLILENQEHWLRNEATFFGQGVRFKNPFGNGGDGVWDSSVTSTIGSTIAGLMGEKL